MKTYSRLHIPSLTRQLVIAGFLAGHAQDAASTFPAPDGILVSQDGGIVENSAFDFECGYGTGVMLSLHIAVDLPALTIWKWQLDLPWKDSQVHWIADPLGSAYDNMYQIPGWDVKFARCQVINHRHVLRRGHSLDGLLLGFSFEPIPASYRHGANIDASLVLIDEMGRDFSTPVQLWANRIAMIDRKQAKANRKGRLFENRDRAENDLILK
jgi:hypothetical protein